MFDSRSCFNPPQANQVILCQLNNIWYTVKKDFINQIGGLFIAKSISIEKLSPNIKELENSNVYQIHSYSHRIYKNTFLVPTTTTPSNNNNVLIVHFYKGAILGHTVDFRQKQHNINNKRCTIKALLTYVNNKNIAVEEIPKVDGNNKTCFCLEHTNEDLRKTKVQPLGVVNCQKNLEISLRSLGLFSKFEEELHFCSIISIFSFDIETSYSKTIYETHNTGIYSENHIECGNLKGRLD